MLIFLDLLPKVIYNTLTLWSSFPESNNLCMLRLIEIESLYSKQGCLQCVQVMHKFTTLGTRITTVA